MVMLTREARCAGGEFGGETVGDTAVGTPHRHVAGTFGLYNPLHDNM